MPFSANRTRLSITLFIALLFIAGLTTSVLLPQTSASGKGSAWQDKTERAREIAEKVKKHRQDEREDERAGERKDKRSPKKQAQQQPQKLERDEVSVFGNRNGESEKNAKLDWPSFKLLDSRLFNEESEEGFDKPREAAEFFKKKRLPVGEKELPVEEYFQAQEQMRQMPQFSTSLNRLLTPAESNSLRQNAEGLTPQVGAATWTSLGPGNIGGRTRAILINPQDTNVMYAAGVSGGVWKSTNAGGAWTPISDLIANLVVSTMVFEPGNPNVIYVGTGEGVYGAENDTQFDFRGAGIFKTTDAGATWTRLQATTTTDFYYVNKLAVSTVDKNRLYAATQTGVMRSTDGGASWTKVLDPIGPRGGTVNAGCLDLALRTDKPTDVVFAACGNSEQATVYRNGDASAAGIWEPVLTETGMGRTSLSIAPSNQEIIYALATSIERNQFSNSLYAVFRSNTGGVSGSWNAQVRNTSANKINRSILSIPPLAVATDCGYDFDDGYVGQGFYDLVIAVDPVDSNRVWVGGIDVARSDDGGVNWGFAGPAYLNNYYELGAIHPDQHTIVFDPKYDGAANQIMYLGNDGGLFRTNNARAAVATTPVSVCNYAQVAIKWTNLNNNYGVTQFYNGAVMPDGKSYFGGTQDNGTLLGTDGTGVNAWKMINGGDGGYAAVDQFNPNILFASYTGFSFRKSTDGGNSFGSATLGLSDDGQFITPFAMDPSDSQRLWTGGAYLWRTTSSAAIWERASAITAGNDLVSAIAIAPADSNRMLVGMADGYILRNSDALTSNSGITWPAVQVRAGYVSSVAFDPTNKDIAYATYSTFGGAHVYRSTDGGQTWSAIDRAGSQNGVPNVPVHTIAIDPSNTARLYIGTDVGVFTTNDGGANWAVETTGFPNVITESLQINITGGVTSVYAFTHGRGVWRATINNSGCTYALSPATRNINANAANGTVNVKASPAGCNWTVASNASWLRVTGAGSSDGTASFQADVNSTFASRTATATIAGRTFTVVQAGRTDVDAPVLAITDPAFSAPAANTSGLINLAGTATDNNAVTSVTWQTDRGASGAATYNATTGRWTVTGVPLSPGNNLITVTAVDAAGNIARASVIVRSVPDAVLITVAGNGVSGTLGDGGQATAAQMTRPWQITFDGAGNLYIADYDNHTIRKVASNGVITTIAGTPATPGFSGDGGPATSALLTNPLGMAFDGEGTLYFADGGNNRIRKITTDGKISTIAGNGSPAFSGDDGPALDASLNFPYGLALDKNGNIFFADFNNNRVRKIAGGKISTVAGNGIGTFNGDDKPATEASLNSPLNVAFDKDGNLIITDNLNYRIRRVGADGKISTIVGTGQSGFAGDGSPATVARVAQPGGAVYDAAGNLYFVDRGNHRVRKVAANTGIITTIAGSGVSGFNGDGLAALASRLNFPNGLALDAAGNVYIGDRENRRVRKLVFAAASDAIAPTVAITAPTGSATFTTAEGLLNLSGTAADNNGVLFVRWSNDRGGSGVAAGTTTWTVPGIALQAGPNNLTVTAFDANGNATSARLLVNFNPQQIITTFAGNGTPGNSGDGGPATGAQLYYPSAVAADAAGNVYIADAINHRVRKVTPGGLIQPFAGNGMLGSSGDGGAALDATLNIPQGVAVDNAGNVYISDTGNNRIRKVTPDGKIAAFAGTGEESYGGDGGPAAQAKIIQPLQVSVDAAGNVYFADSGNLRVRKVTIATGVITTLAGDGRVGNEGNGGPATKAQFILPYGVTVDRNGVVFILDAYDNHVRRVSTDGVITNYVGTGDYGYSGDGGPATSAQIDPLSYITTDADGNLFIADFFNQVIRKVTAATGIITTVVGTNIRGFGGDGTAPLAAQLNYPTDVAFDRAGNLYIADYGNQRVRKVFNASTLKTVSSVSAASFMGESLAADSIAAAFGTNLATGTQSATTLPLPTALGGTTVRVRDASGTERLASIFAVTPGQVNFLIPSGTSNGAATITITGSDGSASVGVAQITSVAPGLFSANMDGQGTAAAVAFRIRANGEQVYEPIARFDGITSKAIAIPIDLGPAGDQVFLIAYGTGWRFRSSLTASSASIGGANADLGFIGSQGGFVGLDQANIRLDRSLAGRGDVEVKLTVDGKTSNIVRINIK